MNGNRFTLAVRVALALGFLIDGAVGAVSIVAPQLIQPLFDIPIHDEIAAQLAGAEFVVVALVYALAWSDPRRYRNLLWILALDQLFAIVLPVVEIARGIFPASWKVIAPIPVSAALVLIFALYALAARRTEGPA